MKGAHAKPATVIASTARYDEICGGAGPSVTIIYFYLINRKNNIISCPLKSDLDRLLITFVIKID